MGRKLPIAFLLAPLLVALAAHRQAPAPASAAFQAFQQRVDSYTALRAKLTKDLPPLPGRATPEQITTHKTALVPL